MDRDIRNRRLSKPPSAGARLPDVRCIQDTIKKGNSANEREVRAGLKRYFGRLWRYGILLSHRRDVADDLVQATSVRALERASQFQAGTRLDRWLFSILRSIWLNEVRARKVRMGQGVVDAYVFVSQILHLADSLPMAQKHTLWLAYIEGLSYCEIAEAMKVPVGTVMSRLASARAGLVDQAAIDPSPTHTLK
jgi:RNA polymerase sigma-70 factor (ECF subfamily)